MKKIRNIGILVTITVLISTLLLNQSLFAGSTELKNSTDSKQITALEKELALKAKPYMKVKNNKFVVSTNAKKVLNTKEVNTVNQYVSYVNQKINESIISMKNNPNIEMTSTETSVKFTLYETAKTNTYSINKSALADYSFEYWGVRLYLHNNLVLKIKSYYNTLLAGSAGAGGVTGAAVAACIKGSVGGPLGAAIAGIITVGGIYCVDRIINMNWRGKGVYIDINYLTWANPWAAAIALNSIYGVE